MPTLKNFLLLFSLYIAACSKETEQTANEPETLTNVAYGSENRQTMDVYLPANRGTKSTKTIVLIHGGGWTAGDKQDFAPFIAELQRRMPNYAIANLNYRLYGNFANYFPTQENDVKAAIAFLKDKSNEYRIDGEMALLGASAGAHLALLQSYKHNDGTIKAVVSLFGPTDLVNLYNTAPNADFRLLLATITGGTPGSAATLYEQSSPINFVNDDSPPTLLLHGGADPLVPASQSVILRDKLQASGVFNQYVFYPNEGHGWVGENLNDTFNKIEAFLEERLK